MVLANRLKDSIHLEPFRPAWGILWHFRHQEQSRRRGGKVRQGWGLLPELWSVQDSGIRTHLGTVPFAQGAISDPSHGSIAMGD